MRHVRLSVGFWVLALASAGPAAVAETREATALFLAGRKLLDAGKPAEACVQFEAAIRLDGTAVGTLLNLGLCNERQGKLRSALAWYRRALSSAQAERQAVQITAANSRIAELIAKVPTISLDFVDGAPSDGKVKINNELVAPGDWGRIELDPGSYAVLVLRPGYLPVSRTVAVQPGDAKRVVIEFTRDPSYGRASNDESADVNAPAAPARPSREPAPRPSRESTGWLRNGLLFTTAGLGVEATQLYLNYRWQQQGNAQATEDAREVYRKRITWAGTSMAVGGGVLIAVGIYYFVWADRERPLALNAAAVAPVVTPDQIGFSYQTRF